MPQPIDSAVIAGLLPQRACQNCVRVKVKCIPQEGSDGIICQRCSRLKRTCLTSTPTVRKRRRNNGSKIVQLENRINELSALVSPASTIPTNSVHNLRPDPLSQIASTLSPNSNQDESRYTSSTARCMDQGSRSPAIVATRSRTAYGLITLSIADDEPSALLIQGDNPDVFRDYPTSNDVESNGQTDDLLTPQHSLSIIGSSTNPGFPELVEFCPIFLDPKLESTLFKDFCTNMSNFFPFVVVDAAASTNMMKRERPFLFWACITAASYHQHQLHRRLVEEMLKGIGEHAFARGTKTLDFLQAILVMLAWYHFYAHLAPQLNNLVHLAKAMIIDLGINRPLKSTNGRTRMTTDSAKSHQDEQTIFDARTSDERRALLGCFFLMSKSSMCYITNLEPMRYTKYMYECCQVLGNLDEFETDATLVHLIELHRITGKCIPDEFTTPNMPMRLYSAMFSDELQRFREKLPQKLESSPVFKAEISYCRFHIYGPSRFTQCDDSMEKLQSLHLCLTGLVECLADLEGITIQQFCRVTFSTWTCVMDSLIMNARLCFLKVDGWDLEYVRSKLNFAGLTQKLIERFEAIREHNSITKPETAAWKFSLYAERLRKCKYWYEAKVALEQRPPTACDQTGSAESLGSAFDLSSFQFDSAFDDMLWGDIMGSWTHF